MGVRKAQDEATATAIRNGSGEASRDRAMEIPTGPATMAVAVLFSMSDSDMVTTISSSSATQAGAP